MNHHCNFIVIALAGIGGFTILSLLLLMLFMWWMESTEIKTKYEISDDLILHRDLFTEEDLEWLNDLYKR